MADKKDGTLIPTVLTTAIKRSKKRSLYKEDKTPSKTPNNNEIPIATEAKMAVFGKVSAMIRLTGLPFF